MKLFYSLLLLCLQALQILFCASLQHVKRGLTCHNSAFCLCLLFLLVPLLPCHAAVSDLSYSSMYMLWTQYVLCSVVGINAMPALGSHKRALEYYFIFTGFRWLFHKKKHTRKIIYSSKKIFQNKRICNTDLRQNVNYAFFFLKKKDEYRPNRSIPSLLFFLLCPQ